MADKYVRMTTPELKELAKERGLHVKKGLKEKELVKLLCTGESEQASASRSTTPGSDPETHSRSSSLEAAKRSPSEGERQRLHELELKRMELKRLELETQREREQQQLEVKRMEMELETKKLKLEEKKLEAQLRLQSNGGNASTPQASGEPPKLDASAFAHYREGDDPAVFLSNFERQAQRCKVPEEKITKYLSALVEGDMAVVLNSLPTRFYGFYKQLIDLPKEWDDMQQERVKVVKLNQASPEYQKVQMEFQKTCGFKINKIERIQNPFLWQQYQIKKLSVDNKNGNQNNERCLFHGTAHSSLNVINYNGFNRGFAGKNAAVIGNGTYFAVHANYSAMDTYSRPDTNGFKHMYLAQVLTGQYCVGAAGMITPPSKNASDPTDLYDSVVDRMNSPSMFVIFNDIQAYPEYLITFRK